MRKHLLAAALWTYTAYVAGNAGVMWAGAPGLVAPLAAVVGLGLFLALYGFGPAHPSIRRVRDAAHAAAGAAASAADVSAADLTLDSRLAR
jgi:hypothetical protein